MADKNLSKITKNNTNNKLLIFIVPLAVLLIVLWFFVLEGYYIFYQTEKVFLAGGKKYFEMNSQQLPKNNGDYRTVELSKLYETLSVEILNVPKKKEYCDVNSWVRVIKNDQGEYEYYGYLKCGKYQSATDHVGPVITLNGDDTIYMKVNDEYQELGVKEVKDKKDGNIDINSVTIDRSQLKTDTIGDYQVKYTVFDKLKNRTVKERTVKVVISLTDMIGYQTNGTNVYQGRDVNNYLIYSGMLWRIIKINDDKTIKIITDDSISNVNYGLGEYDQTNIKHWLNNVFYKALNNDKKWIKEDSTWCVDNVENVSGIANCVKYSETAPVGLLDLSEVKASENNTGSYLNAMSSYWLMNSRSNNAAWIKFLFASDNYLVMSYDKLERAAVRPVINIKAEDIYLAEGDGTIDMPFKINDYQYGQVGQEIKSRLMGEYINISGYLWRISGHDNDGNTKLIMADVIKDLTTNEIIEVAYTDQDAVKKFDVNKIENIGYKINNDYIKFVNDKLFVNSKFDIPLFDGNKKYYDYDKYQVEAKFAIPTSYELFSGVNGNPNYSSGRYWLADYTLDEYRIFFVNSNNGLVFREVLGNFPLNNIRLVGYLNKDVKIASGLGTFNNPYYVR